MSDGTIVVGETLALSGSVSPHRSGTLYQLQQRIDGRWTVVGSGTVPSDGRLAGSARPATGVQEFRFAVDSSADVAAAASSSAYVRVEGHTALAVVVRGLPAGQPAAVTLTGPRGDSMLTASATVSPARPGRWTVSAAPVTTSGGTYRAAEPTQTVDLAAGDSRTVVVQYEPPGTRELVLNGARGRVAIEKSGAPASFTFSASAGDKVAFAVTDVDLTVSAELDVTVQDPRGRTVETEPPGWPSPRSRWVFTAADSGPYVVTVRARHLGTGSLSANVSTPSIQSAAPNGPSVALSSQQHPGRELGAEFTARVGDYVSVRQDGLTGRDNPFRLVRVDDGRTVSPLGEGEGAVGWVGSAWSISADGRYRFEIEPAFAERTSFDLSVLSTRAEQEVVVNRETVHAEVDRAGGLRVVPMRLQERGEVTVALSDVTMTAGGYQAAFLTSDGGLVGGATHERPLGYPSYPQEPGRFLLVVNPLGDATGSLDIDVSTPKVVDSVPGGPPVQVTSEGRAGRELRVRFPAAKGDYAVTRSTVSADVVGPRGVDVARAMMNDETREPVYELGFSPAWQIEADGTYVAQYVPRTVLNASVKVAIFLERPATLAPGSTTRVSRARPSGLAVLAVDTRADERYALDTAWADPSRVQENDRYAAYLDGGHPLVPVEPRTTFMAPSTAPQTLVVTVRDGSASDVLVSLDQPRRHVVTPNGSGVTISNAGARERTVRATFDAKAGDFLSHHLVPGAGWDARLQLVRHEPDGSVERDHPARAYQEEQRDGAERVWRIERDGRYSLDFVPRSDGDMSARLSIFLTRPVETAYESRRSIGVTRPGQIAVLDMAYRRPTIDVRLSAFALRRADGSGGAARLWTATDISGQLGVVATGSSVSRLPVNPHSAFQPERFFVVVDPVGDTTGSLDLVVDPGPSS
ncbi:MAG: hypothetical protein PGN07_06430 [Aeromicrobium erythreum]